MHRVWFGEGDGRERFNQLATKLRTSGGLEAVESVLGIEAKRFTPEISRHLRRIGTTRELPFDEAGLRRRMQIGPAEAAMVAVQLSNLLFSSGKEAEADQELRAAQSFAPEAPFIKEAMARRELRRGEGERAVALYREAIAQGSANPRAYLISAGQWLDSTTSHGVDQLGGGGIFADKALSDVRQAIQLSPGNIQAYRLMGRALFLRPEVSFEHVDELSVGIGPADDDGQVRFYRSFLFERLKRFEEAKTDLELLVTSPRTGPAIRQQSEQRLHQMAFNKTVDRVNELARQRKFGEAREWIANQQQTPAGQALAEHYNKLLKWVDNAERRAASAQ
jgi:tetratricopeptide (TPR) repeat protein